MDAMSSVYYFRVLYDDVLLKQLTVPRTSLGITGGGNITFGDINGLPTFPFRRALYFMAESAYLRAIASERPHNCASIFPDEQGWKDIRDASSATSDFANYLHAQDSDNSSDLELISLSDH